MDKTTMTKSSQSFYAFMAMTMTALSVNANASELNSDFTANACSFAYTSSASDEPILQDKIYLFPKKRILGRDIRDCLNLSGLKKRTMVKL